ncbi:hypothetical protein M218_09475 [Burkholderia pseudomallei MSHR338]|uniref:Uncharacterized protein n=2 Tax=Burkholderia pseudomallei TaxID=28450 RepID=Q3JS91_BURP1|nr:hypothetical protein BURPS1710b_2167 [Burkholderia pseudomallei 1710b]EDO84106.1 hypothetical protein BURPS406E_H0969 [Burkholderia pseudomallei 406e]EDO92195.1 hypothetical protein BURPSPAST_AA0674 [Burkholderia pseudomallei Pasteur 52237]EDU07339.1 hypothetical protein BURPS1655_A1770 [Burkholderia pseudomallei 1655]EEC35535.1 hypothetical protein BUC_2130 [Burkholderia pseudomallei 576]EET08484.1 hypothetical protein BURPS1710A_2483 [Burkholderia pseudomallei 1710a]EQA89335.1 hypothetic
MLPRQGIADIVQANFVHHHHLNNASDDFTRIMSTYRSNFLLQRSVPLHQIQISIRHYLLDIQNVNHIRSIVH